MTLGIDIDGVLTDAPEIFKELMIALKKNGDKVYIISGVGVDNDEKKSRKFKLGQLKQLGIDEKCYDSLHVAVMPIPQSKRELCKKLGVEFMIDNDLSFVSKIIDVTPCGLFLPKIPGTFKSAYKKIYKK